MNTIHALLVAIGVLMLGACDLQARPDPSGCLTLPDSMFPVLDFHDGTWFYHGDVIGYAATEEDSECITPVSTH